jgi:hypothetical protein
MDHTFTIEELKKVDQAFDLPQNKSDLYPQDFVTFGRLQPILEIPERKRIEEKAEWGVTLAKPRVEKKKGTLTIGGQKYEVFRVQLGFTARPPKQFVIKKVTVDVVFDRECVQISDAINIGMAPKDIEEKTTIIRKRGIKPKISLKFGDKISAEGELFEYTQSEELNVAYPEIDAFYRGQPRAAWEFSSTPSTPQVRGDKTLELLVRQKPDCTTHASITVKGDIENISQPNQLMRFILRKGPTTDWDELSFTIG